jgi:hypothetical protein
MISRIAIARDMGQSMHDIMRRDERAKGYRLVLPGWEPWLSASDWHETNVVSVDGERVRLVAIWAKNPGRGAFRRLVAAIQAAGLKPCVFSPHDEFAATLKRWGWKEKRRGYGMDHEEWWEPRRARKEKAPLPRIGR